MAFGDLSGQMLGKYELRAQIGAGGMGAVYRAYQADLKRSVAVKVLPFGLSDDPNYLERFNREAAVSASLEHAHIVPVYDYGTEGNVTYVVMRLLTGGNLSERIKIRQDQHESLPSLPEISELLKDLASALDYAHSQQVIHRDIKPTNVMFDNQGSPFLVDFGIAKLMQSTSGLTETGQTPGTPVFMAPEQWKAEEVGPATDQYALGILSYLLVTGRVPFEADTPYQIMHKHFYEMPTPPHAHRSDLPEAVTRVLNRVLEKEPNARFPSVTEFAKSFERAVAGQQDEATNFFVFKLPQKVDDEATYVGDAKRAGTKSTLQSQPTRQIRSNRALWGRLGALAGVVVIAIALFMLFGGGDGDNGDDNEGLAAVDAEATQTALAETEIAAIVPPTSTETLIPTDTSTPTVLPTSTETLIATNTSTPTVLPTSTETPIPTETFTPTLDAREAALATNQVEGTINAERTAIFIENQTATATLWTETPRVVLTAVVEEPTLAPTLEPTDEPTLEPTIEPTEIEVTEVTVFEPTESGETVEVSIWIRDGDEADSIRRAVDDFNVTQSAYRIVETSPAGNGSHDELIAVAADSDELACIFDVDGAYVYRYVYSGDVIALDDYLSDDFMADLLPSVVDQGTVNGQFYTVGRFETGIAIWANRSLLEQAGVRIPQSVDETWTLEEFNAVLAALAETTPHPGGLVIGMNMNFASEWYSYALSPILQSFGGDIIDRETLSTADGFLNSPETIAGLEWLQSIFENGYSSPSSSIDLSEAFGNRTLPLFLGGTWAYYWFADSLGDDLVVIPMPDFGNGPVTSGGSMQWVVSSDCEHPEGAAAFLEFVYQPDYLDWIVSAHAEMPPTYSLMEWFDVFQPGGTMYIFREQLENGEAVLRPKSPVYEAISNAMYELISTVAYGGDPAAAANAAVERIDAAIQAVGG